ncbi:DUF5318 family protein [Corynebacterium aquatimens]|uniref:Zn-ribbon and HTH transcriptional regulator n=1 Tax=Corynebacterium aquatimens TaxID=1190508 RepID=A0A931E2L3_9CORY|nr:DUF5318 family protein [Corynebacterium aquatimens]MBG6122782.1 putative Zn-ribbon and HTH transcriptional regulator [Corynebacterium aquatimens]WJY66883.1 hypothetical protein CAQUA_11000 [Corynebacterium aquatimens]
MLSATTFRLTHEISHEWLRRTTLRDYHAGRIPREQLCDADFLLKAAAKYHGVESPRRCPICESDMHDVLWVHSDNLGRKSNTARSAEEIALLIDEVGPITVHRVEVCRSCGWNHLLVEGIAVAEDAPVT